MFISAYPPAPHLLCLFSSNYAVATVSLGFDPPDDQKTHSSEILLVLNTHQWQLSNPPAGSNSPQSVKHTTWKAFTVKHLKLLETGCARHMLPKWEGLLITQEVRQRQCGAESLIGVSAFVVARSKGNMRNSPITFPLIILMLSVQVAVKLSRQRMKWGFSACCLIHYISVLDMNLNLLSVHEPTRKACWIKKRTMYFYLLYFWNLFVTYFAGKQHFVKNKVNKKKS